MFFWDKATLVNIFSDKLCLFNYWESGEREIFPISISRFEASLYINLRSIYPHISPSTCLHNAFEFAAYPRVPCMFSTWMHCWLFYPTPPSGRLPSPSPAPCHLPSPSPQPDEPIQPSPPGLWSPNFPLIKEKRWLIYFYININLKFSIENN